MSTTWWIIAVCMVFAVPLILEHASRAVAKRTGREMQSDKAVAYELVYFLLALCIGIPPIYLFPDRDTLFYVAFMFAGIIVGTLVAQAYFGRRKPQ